MQALNSAINEQPTTVTPSSDLPQIDQGSSTLNVRVCEQTASQDIVTKEPLVELPVTELDNVNLPHQLLVPACESTIITLTDVDDPLEAPQAILESAKELENSTTDKNESSEPSNSNETNSMAAHKATENEDNTLVC